MEAGGGQPSRPPASDDEVDSEGFLLRPRDTLLGGDGSEDSADEVDSEGFLLRPRDAPAGQEASSRPTPQPSFLSTWRFKREHLPDADRYDRPYVHKAFGTELRLEQRRHDSGGAPGGFASTVWDSSIVVAKFLERHRASLTGKRAIELGAGVGLVSAALAGAGATVTATDLPANLELLRSNLDAAAKALGVDAPAVAPLEWGDDTGAAALRPPFDVVVACDCMYKREAVSDLIASLESLSKPGTRLFVAHGRNRFAEADFLELVVDAFSVEDVPEDALEPNFKASDVRVLELTPRMSRKRPRHGE